MRIDRLTLQGFKSFGERTVLDFGPGVFGIVGPNGSGKSNLVEALRWVVGARARDLRGEEAQSLLFHGADGKAPLGFAEVTLELSHGPRRRSLLRRLEREGSSEIRLDGARASLRQVEAALMGTGLSRNGYAVVGQGEVGQILQAGPEVLLAYLEEAAGLRAVTQAARATREHLELATTELQARLAETAERRQALALKLEQAAAAREAAELATQVLTLRRSVRVARMAEAAAEVQAAQAKAAGLEAERAAISTRLAQLGADKVAALEQLEQAQAAHSEAAQQAEALAGELRLMAQEESSQRRLLQRAAQDLGEAQARAERLRAISPPALPPLQEPDPQLQQSQEARLAELLASLRAEELHQQAAQAAYERFLQAQTAFEVQQAAFRKAQLEHAQAQAEASRLETKLAEVTAALAETEALEQRLRRELDGVVRREGSLTGELRAAQAEAERLNALIRSGSDLAEGPRRARNSGIAGIVGIVADLLEVPAPLELALETALGGRLGWVLCESEAAAQAAIEYLKRQGGRATFLPRTLLRPVVRRSRDWSKEPGVLGLARELVELPACPEALPTLLGELLVLETLEAALHLRKQALEAPRMVTLEGELLEPSGALTGGRSARGGQVLSLRRRLSETRRDTERLRAEAQALQQEAEGLRAQLKGLGLETLRRQQVELQTELRGVKAFLGRQAHQTLPQPPEPVPPPEPSRLAALRAEREALSAEIALGREAMAMWQRYREDQARYAEAQEQLGELEARLEQLKTEQAELETRLQALQVAKADLETARARLNLEAQEADLRQARQRLRALAEEESQLVTRTNTLLADLEALHFTQARREATLEALQAELNELPQGPVENGSARSLSRMLGEVEARLAALGPVNHLAQQEAAELQAGVARLEAALTEAEAVVAKLTAELHQVEGQYHQQLESKYGVFKEKFAQYTEALLGAEAHLERSQGGLKLWLRPAGKRGVSLELLSMGERTMGALAFLFALSEVGEGAGLPIAVLDEVDAPLDEANIQRFCHFLRKFSNQTQFILVTHQKRTMEACDALYGVAADQGLSKLWSIKAD
ncbi:AAA family ATPase [Meiothermus granaticius]|uniref:Chromosome partition protein Smc n=1 Tax=Meiothermus granaticius NBRC 107808 TaxID=1227551 RepID=A0A399F750_9DEIN|nr:AAA family ATPase [Meiothermus granaticius]RIH92058.1 Chromosome partition protein Smc [Meiothermus granaticius NBRC 107808]GEM85397.1 chromosome partitioning protein Smc [Meiothermus granaticius NBRC 107808]